ncbi:aldo/keto reductase [Amycolatopsis japonica]|uniref:aldo/keto reductase n=1 Tax=Amycolatopsis japonica TaxID=208439 RepID=UPI003670AC4B
MGVSNFEQRDLENILTTATVTPHVNQLLVHAGNTPSELLAYCETKDILVEAYSPTAHGAILDNPDIKTMAAKYGVSVPQLCIRYTLQLGTVSLPKPPALRTCAPTPRSASPSPARTWTPCGTRRRKTMASTASFPSYSGE